MQSAYKLILLNELSFLLRVGGRPGVELSTAPRPGQAPLGSTAASGSETNFHHTLVLVHVMLSESSARRDSHALYSVITFCRYYKSHYLGQ